MTPGDRIRSGSTALGMSLAEIARNAGILPQDLQRILDGRVQRSKHFPAIAKALADCDVEWLTVGAGRAPSWFAVTPSPRAAEMMAAYVSTHPRTESLDVVGVVTAGDGDLTHYEELPEPTPWRIPPSWKVVQVFGKSAYPVIYEGQWAVVDTERGQRPPFAHEALVDLHDNVVLVQTEDNRGFLKRFCWAPGAPGDFILASIDSGKSSPFVPPDSIIIVVPVVGTFFIDPSQPRAKRWHNKTVTVDMPGAKP